MAIGEHAKVRSRKLKPPVRAFKWAAINIQTGYFLHTPEGEAARVELLAAKLRELGVDPVQASDAR
jgi:hypothetical protein